MIRIVILIMDGNLFLMGLGHPRTVFGKTPEPYVPDDRDNLLLGLTGADVSVCLCPGSLPVTAGSAISLSFLPSNTFSISL